MCSLTELKDGIKRRLTISICRMITKSQVLWAGSIVGCRQ